MLIRFNLAVLLLMLGVIGAVSGVVLVTTYQEVDRSARIQASETYVRATQQVRDRVDAILGQARVLTQSAVQLPGNLKPVIYDGLSHEGLQAFSSILLQNPFLYSLYFAHNNGDFFQVTTLQNDPVVRAALEVPRDTTFLVRAIVDEGGGERWESMSFLDDNLDVVGRKPPTRATYDPRLRPWFPTALGSDATQLSNAYLFSDGHNRGLTFSQVLPRQRGVLGVDIVISTLEDVLLNEDVSPNAQLALVDQADTALAGARVPLDILKRKAEPLTLEAMFLNRPEGEFLLHSTPLVTENGQTFYAVAFGPYADFSERVRELQRNIAVVVLVVTLISFPLIYFFARRLTGTLSALSEDALRVQQFRFEETSRTRTVIREVAQLGSAFALMKQTIRGRTRELEYAHGSLKLLVDRSIALSSAKGATEVNVLITRTANDLARASWSLLFLLDSQGMRCAMGSVGGEETGGDRSGVPPFAETLSRRLQNAVRSLPDGEPVDTTPPTPVLEDVLYGLFAAADLWSGTVTAAVLPVRLVSGMGNVVGLLLVGKAAPEDVRDRGVDGAPFTEHEVGFLQSLSSQAANIEELRRREVKLEDLVQERTGELRRSEERARSIIHNAADGIVVTDCSGVIQVFSPSAEKIFGYPAQEAIGENVTMLMPPRWSEDTVRRLLKGSGRRVAGFAQEVQGRRSDGSLFPMDLAIGRAEVGDTVLYTGIMRDISDRKEAELQLVEAYGIIKSSIDYASHIQCAILPAPDTMLEVLPDHMVLWEPRDVVGGDFFDVGPWGEGILVLLGDCTGHGVPGAFVTLLANGALERARHEVAAGDLAGLVGYLHRNIQTTLGQDQAHGQFADGLDLGACYLTPGSNRLLFVGAHFDLFVVTAEGVTRVRGEPSGVGYPGIPGDHRYRCTEVILAEGSRVYMTSDGIIDQVGGPKRRGFGKKRFEQLLQTLWRTPLPEQASRVAEALSAYQDEEARRDDVSVIGFTVPSAGPDHPISGKDKDDPGEQIG